MMSWKPVGRRTSRQMPARRYRAISLPSWRAWMSKPNGRGRGWSAPARVSTSMPKRASMRAGCVNDRPLRIVSSMFSCAHLAEDSAAAEPARLASSRRSRGCGPVAGPPRCAARPRAWARSSAGPSSGATEASRASSAGASARSGARFCLLRAARTWKSTSYWNLRGEFARRSLTLLGVAFSTSKVFVLEAEHVPPTASGCSHETVTVRLGGAGITRSTPRPPLPGFSTVTPGSRREVDVVRVRVHVRRELDLVRRVQRVVRPVLDGVPRSDVDACRLAGGARRGRLGRAG